MGRPYRNKNRIFSDVFLGFNSNFKNNIEIATLLKLKEILESIKNESIANRNKAEPKTIKNIFKVFTGQTSGSLNDVKRAKRELEKNFVGIGETFNFHSFVEKFKSLDNLVSENNISKAINFLMSDNMLNDVGSIGLMMYICDINGNDRLKDFLIENSKNIRNINENFDFKGSYYNYDKDRLINNIIDISKDEDFNLGINTQNFNYYGEKTILNKLIKDLKPVKKEVGSFNKTSKVKSNSNKRFINSKEPVKLKSGLLNLKKPDSKASVKLRAGLLESNIPNSNNMNDSNYNFDPVDPKIAAFVQEKYGYFVGPKYNFEEDKKENTNDIFDSGFKNSNELDEKILFEKNDENPNDENQQNTNLDNININPNNININPNNININPNNTNNNPDINPKHNQNDENPENTNPIIGDHKDIIPDENKDRKNAPNRYEINRNLLDDNPNPIDPINQNTGNKNTSDLDNSDLLEKNMKNDINDDSIKIPHTKDNNYLPDPGGNINHKHNPNGENPQNTNLDNININPNNINNNLDNINTNLDNINNNPNINPKHNQNDENPQNTNPIIGDHKDIIPDENKDRKNAPNRYEINRNLLDDNPNPIDPINPNTDDINKNTSEHNFSFNIDSHIFDVPDIDEEIDNDPNPYNNPFNNVIPEKNDNDPNQNNEIKEPAWLDKTENLDNNPDFNLNNDSKIGPKNSFNNEPNNDSNNDSNNNSSIGSKNENLNIGRDIESDFSYLWTRRRPKVKINDNKSKVLNNDSNDNIIPSVPQIPSKEEPNGNTDDDAELKRKREFVIENRKRREEIVKNYMQKRKEEQERLEKEKEEKLKKLEKEKEKEKEHEDDIDVENKNKNNDINSSLPSDDKLNHNDENGISSGKINNNNNYNNSDIDINNLFESPIFSNSYTNKRINNKNKSEFDFTKLINEIDREEKERLERERVEKERLEKERVEKERLEREEKERLEREEKERLEREEKERLEQMKILENKDKMQEEELALLDKEIEGLKKEQEKLKQLEREKLEQERLKKEQERLKEEQERLKKEKERQENERQEKENEKKEQLNLVDEKNKLIDEKEKNVNHEFINGCLKNLIAANNFNTSLHNLLLNPHYILMTNALLEARSNIFSVLSHKSKNKLSELQAKLKEGYEFYDFLISYGASDVTYLYNLFLESDKEALSAMQNRLPNFFICYLTRDFGGKVVEKLLKKLGDADGETVIDDDMINTVVNEISQEYRLLFNLKDSRGVMKYLIQCYNMFDACKDFSIIEKSRLLESLKNFGLAGIQENLKKSALNYNEIETFLKAISKLPDAKIDEELLLLKNSSETVPINFCILGELFKEFDTMFDKNKNFNTNELEKLDRVLKLIELFAECAHSYKISGLGGQIDINIDVDKNVQLNANQFSSFYKKMLDLEKQVLNKKISSDKFLDNVEKLVLEHRKTNKAFDEYVSKLDKYATGVLLEKIAKNCIMKITNDLPESAIFEFPFNNQMNNITARITAWKKDIAEIKQKREQIKNIVVGINTQLDAINKKYNSILATSKEKKIEEMKKKYLNNSINLHSSSSDINKTVVQKK